MNALIEGGRANPYTTHENAGIAANSTVKVWRDHEVGSFVDAVQLHERVLWAVHKGQLRRDLWIREGFGVVDVKIASNVYLRAYDRNHITGSIQAIAVVLYDTEIVRYYQDGTFSVSNGGFNTPTTSMRVIQFTPDGWYAWHKDKQLVLGSYGRDPIYPATHATRVRP